VYLSGSGEPERSIFWLDPTGKTEPLHPAPGLYNGLQFSPDGKRLVFGMGDVLAKEELWVQDLERNTSVRLTSLGGVSTSPLWSPDGKYILFAHQPNDTIYRVHADGPASRNSWRRWRRPPSSLPFHRTANAWHL
jgi:TolB protein